MQSAIIGLGIGYSPYVAEVFRAGIDPIDRGQTEAALSIGMAGGLMMRRGVLRQVVRVALLPYGGVMAMLLKHYGAACRSRRPPNET